MNLCECPFFLLSMVRGPLNIYLGHRGIEDRPRGLQQCVKKGRRAMTKLVNSISTGMCEISSRLHMDEGANQKC